MKLYFAMCPELSSFPIYYSEDMGVVKSIIKDIAFKIDPNAQDRRKTGSAYWRADDEDFVLAFIYITLDPSSPDDLLEYALRRML